MKFTTKDMVVAALLTGMSIIIPNIFPSLPLGPFTATFASHVPVMIAMFISPVVALLASIGSVIGFAVKFAAMPWVIARAAMHIPFSVLGAFMLKKNINKYVTMVVTMLVHAALEVVAVLPFIGMMTTADKSMSIFGMTISIGWAAVIFFGTAIHHVIDFAIAFAVVSLLKKTGYIKVSEKLV